MEETIFSLLGLDMFTKDDPRVLKWDVQLHTHIAPLVENVQKNNPRAGRHIEHIAAKLGIAMQPRPTEHRSTLKNLVHNAGMDASFCLEMLLVLVFITLDQLALAQKNALAPLPARFSTGSIAENWRKDTTRTRPTCPQPDVAGAAPGHLPSAPPAPTSSSSGVVLELPPGIMAAVPPELVCGPNKILMPPEMVEEILLEAFIDLIPLDRLIVSVPPLAR